MSALDLHISRPPEWMDGALCAQVDPELFYPDKGGSTREAKQVCARCQVWGQCLSYALERNERFGVWGGYSDRERRRIKQRAAQRPGLLADLVSSREVDAA